MSRSAWGVVVATLFAIVLQWTHLPDWLPAPLILLAWVALVLCCTGWLFSHIRPLQRLRSRQTAAEDIDVTQDRNPEMAERKASGQTGMGRAPCQGFLLSAGGSFFFFGLTGGMSSGCGAIWAGWLLGEG